jgi:multiple sugar transport system permease protein
MALKDQRLALGQPATDQERAVVAQPTTSGARQINRVKYLFILPGILWILAFTVFPLLYAVRLSFYNAKLGSPERFIGLANFRRALFEDDRLWQALGVTVRFVAVSVVATVLLGLLLALLFNRPMRGLPIFRAIFTMPLFVPAIAIAYLTLTIVHENGPINNVLMLFGLPKPLPFLSDPFWAFIAVAAVDVWQWTPFAFIVLLAGLQSLPDEIYEAAALDTSSGWQVFRFVTLPLLTPVITTVAILRTVEAFKVIDIPFALTNGGPGVATRTYTFYTYITGLKNFDLGYGSAISLLFMVLLVIISTVFFIRARHIYD